MGFWLSHGVLAMAGLAEDQKWLELKPREISKSPDRTEMACST